MSISTRLAPRLRPAWSLLIANSSRGFANTTKTAKEEWPQKFPLGLYYESVLNAPSPYPFEEKPEEPPNSADPSVLPPGKKPAPVSAPPETKRKPGRPRKNNTTASSQTSSGPSSVSQPAPTPPPATAQDKARIIFGSRLLGPAEQADRLAVKQANSKYIAGILVPPKPDEPDNCCMSGCVDCVWERYREEMEDWSTMNHEAQRRLLAGSQTVDADGGGSEAGWGVNVGDTKIAKDLWDEDIFEGVPVGIREFMKQEKRLKERHERDGTFGG
ncbi:hypothetical protein G7046_g3327 [Stylonectria norvegica]|nr:hypothetical protein G7046_g3327 [Stylonectria norvegica]